MASSYELLQRHCVLSASVHRIEISRPAAAIRRGAGGTRSAATPGARRPHAVEHTELSALGGGIACDACDAQVARWRDERVSARDQTVAASASAARVAR
jgi:hypothetical protein